MSKPSPSDEHHASGSKRFVVLPAVFVVVEDEQGRVLLHCRQNTGYMDGRYDFPSGHLEPGETLPEGAARELLEETGLRVRPEDLKLINLMQNYSEPSLPYINFIFRARVWTGTPAIGEPHKCSDLAFFAKSKLPRITPQVRQVLTDYANSPKLNWSYFDPERFAKTLATIDGGL